MILELGRVFQKIVALSGKISYGSVSLSAHEWANELVCQQVWLGSGGLMAVRKSGGVFLI